MKILQDPDSGKAIVQLASNESYDIEEILSALLEFVSKQAVEVYRLTHSYREIVHRLDELESKFSQTKAD
jgi:hypothetical protein